MIKSNGRWNWALAVLCGTVFISAATCDAGNVMALSCAMRTYAMGGLLCGRWACGVHLRRSADSKEYMARALEMRIRTGDVLLRMCAQRPGHAVAATRGRCVD